MQMLRSSNAVLVRVLNDPTAILCNQAQEYRDRNDFDLDIALSGSDISQADLSVGTHEHHKPTRDWTIKSTNLSVHFNHFALNLPYQPPEHLTINSVCIEDVFIRRPEYVDCKLRSCSHLIGPFLTADLLSVSPPGLWMMYLVLLHSKCILWAVQTS